MADTNTLNLRPVGQGLNLRALSPESDTGSDKFADMTPDQFDAMPIEELRKIDPTRAMLRERWQAMTPVQRQQEITETLNDPMAHPVRNLVTPRVTKQLDTGETIDLFKALGQASGFQQDPWPTLFNPPSPTTPEQIKEMENFTPFKIAKGANNAVIEMGEFFTSPLGVMTLGTGALPAAAQRIIAAGFAADMAANLPKETKELRDAIKSGDAEKISHAVVLLGGNAAFTTLAAKHAIKGGKNPAVAPTQEGQPDFTEINKTLQKGVEPNATNPQQQQAGGVGEHQENDVGGVSAKAGGGGVVGQPTPVAPKETFGAKAVKAGSQQVAAAGASVGQQFAQAKSDLQTALASVSERLAAARAATGTAGAGATAAGQAPAQQAGAAMAGGREAPGQASAGVVAAAEAAIKRANKALGLAEATPENHKTLARSLEELANLIRLLPQPSSPAQPSQEKPSGTPSQRQGPDAPNNAAKDSGWSFNPTSQLGGMSMEGLTPDQIEQFTKQIGRQWEFTDRRKGSATEGITVYVPEGTAYRDILQAIKKKESDITAARQGGPQVEQSIWPKFLTEFWGAPEPPPTGSLFSEGRMKKAKATPEKVVAAIDRAREAGVPEQQIVEMSKERSNKQLGLSTFLKELSDARYKATHAPKTEEGATAVETPPTLEEQWSGRNRSAKMQQLSEAISNSKLNPNKAFTAQEIRAMLNTSEPIEDALAKKRFLRKTTAGTFRLLPESRIATERAIKAQFGDEAMEKFNQEGDPAVPPSTGGPRRPTKEERQQAQIFAERYGPISEKDYNQLIQYPNILGRETDTKAMKVISDLRALQYKPKYRMLGDEAARNNQMLQDSLKRGAKAAFNKEKGYKYSDVATYDAQIDATKKQLAEMETYSKTAVQQWDEGQRKVLDLLKKKKPVLIDDLDKFQIGQQKGDPAEHYQLLSGSSREMRYVAPGRAKRVEIGGQERFTKRMGGKAGPITSMAYIPDDFSDSRGGSERPQMPVRPEELPGYVAPELMDKGSRFYDEAAKKRHAQLDEEFQTRYSKGALRRFVDEEVSDIMRLDEWVNEYFTNQKRLTGAGFYTTEILEELAGEKVTQSIWIYDPNTGQNVAHTPAEALPEMVDHIQKNYPDLIQLTKESNESYEERHHAFLRDQLADIGLGEFADHYLNDWKEGRAHVYSIDPPLAHQIDAYAHWDNRGYFPGKFGGPGAAVPEDVGAAPQLKQLNDSIKTLAEESTARPRLKEAYTRGEQWDRLKGKGKIAWEGLKAGGRYMKQWVEAKPVVTDWKLALGNRRLSLTQSVQNARSFMMDSFKAFPDPVRRGAMSAYVDMGGDMELLREAETQAPEAYKKYFRAAQNLTPDEQFTVDNIRSYFDSRLDEAVDGGVLQAGIEDYIHRYYPEVPDFARKLINELGSGIYTGKPSLAKQRVMRFDLDAMLAGHKPEMDFAKRVAAYDMALNKSLADRKLVADLFRVRASDGNPVMKIGGRGSGLQNDDGFDTALLVNPKAQTLKPGAPLYITREYPALRKWKWVNSDNQGKDTFVFGDALIHPKWVGKVDALFKPSSVRKWAVGRAALGISNTVKQTALDLSLFHPVQLTVHGIEHRVFEPYGMTEALFGWKRSISGTLTGRNRTVIDLSDPTTQGLIRNGLVVADVNGAGLFAEGLQGASLTRLLPFGVGEKVEQFNDWLFSDWIPRLKLRMAMAALKRNQKLFPNLSDNELYALTANQSNSAFGELDWEGMGVSKTTRDWMRLILLAPDFLIARLKYTGQALSTAAVGSVDVARAVANKPVTPLYHAEQGMAMLVFGGLVNYILARILNKFINGSYHWEKPNAFSVVYNGRSYSLRTAHGDLMHAINDFPNFAYNRLNPVYARTFMEMGNRRDQFGRTRNWMEQMQDFGRIIIPISVRGLLHPNEQSLLESLWNAAGVTAHRNAAIDNIYRLAENFKKQHNIGEPAERIYDADKDIYRGVKLASLYSDPNAVADEIERAVKANKFQLLQLRRHFDQYARRPFTGSRQHEAQFYNQLLDDNKRIYQDAVEEREKMMRNLEAGIRIYAERHGLGGETGGGGASGAFELNLRPLK